MMQLSSKMMTHSVMTSSLRIKNFRIDKFGDFDIDFKTKIDREQRNIRTGNYNRKMDHG